MLCFLPVVLGGALPLATPPATPVSIPSHAAVATHTLLTAPFRRVRTTNPRVQTLLARGLQRSSTFVQLVRALNDTDVIVYIEPVGDLPKTIAGRIFLVPLAGDQRYLRIQICAQGTEEDSIAIIAHELRHALEIAGAPDVRDVLGVVALYRRIGVAGPAHRFDTLAAQTTGKQVRKELAG